MAKPTYFRQVQRLNNLDLTIANRCFLHLFTLSFQFGPNDISQAVLSQNAAHLWLSTVD